MELQLGGKTAVVTGASKGIGLCVAQTLAAEGVHLHLVSRTEETLRQAKTTIEAGNDVRVSVHPLDLSRSGAAEQLVQACGDADILINNAGAIPGGDLHTVVEERWREAWDLKVFGYINLTRTFLERMQARGDGVIVNVIGLAGERPEAGYIAGSAGNASLIAFTRGLGARSLDYGVRVVGINPGPVETDRIVQLFRRRALDEFGDEERWREFMAKQPLGRAATPQEIANAVVFVASPAASYICGTVLTVDGGLAGRTP